MRKFADDHNDGLLPATGPQTTSHRTRSGTRLTATVAPQVDEGTRARGSYHENGRGRENVVGHSRLVQDPPPRSTIRSVYGWGGEECCVCIIIFIHATWRGPPVAAAAAARPVDRCRFRVYRHSAAQRSLSPSRLYSVTTKPESTAVVIQGSRLLYFLDRSYTVYISRRYLYRTAVLQECTWPAGTGSSGQHRLPAVRGWGGPVNMSYWDHQVSISLHPPT